jgi:hypothetical protein
VSDFQLILLSERERPVRERAAGASALIRFPLETRMAAIASGASPEIKPNAEEVASWYTPIEACAYAAQIFGPEKASDAIWERLVGGMIEAVATATSIMYGDDSPATTREPTFIPRFYWRHISNKGTDIWGACDVRFFIPARLIQAAKPRTVRCFGVKLNPRDIHETLPPIPPDAQRWAPEPLTAPYQEPSPKKPESVTKPTVPTNKGGRPRKEWWDDFWIEICRQIYDNELKPKTQADLERAMLEWVENHDAGVGEATIKAAAKKPFKAWNLGSKT